MLRGESVKLSLMVSIVTRLSTSLGCRSVSVTIRVRRPLPLRTGLFLAVDQAKNTATLAPMKPQMKMSRLDMAGCGGAEYRGPGDGEPGGGGGGGDGGRGMKEEWEVEVREMESWEVESWEAERQKVERQEVKR